MADRWEFWCLWKQRDTSRAMRDYADVQAFTDPNVARRGHVAAFEGHWLPAGASGGTVTDLFRIDGNRIVELVQVGRDLDVHELPDGCDTWRDYARSQWRRFAQKQTDLAGDARRVLGGRR